jgi:Primase X
MPSGPAPLSELEQKYPFAPSSRKFLESMSLEEAFASAEVTLQAQRRLLAAVGRGRHEPHMSGETEFLSFFAAAFVACQNQYLASKFSKSEGERAKESFKEELPKAKSEIVEGCFGVSITHQGSRESLRYSVPFQGYLSLVSRFQLTRDVRWKLVRQSLDSGTVHMGDNMLNDLFGECAAMAVMDGVKGLRKGSFPKQLEDARDAVFKYVPVLGPKTGKGYLYVEDLLKHPVTDGRHRLTWLVLAPYLVNVRKLSDEEAVEKIRDFVAAGAESHGMKRFVEYNVRRARRNGLLPPTYSTLKTEHPDIYWLLPKEVVAAEETKAPRRTA